MAGAARWQVGDRIRQRYQVERVMPGGMGVVYRVFDPESGLPLAIKTFQDQARLANPTIAARFRREASAWVALDAHPNVTRALGLETVEEKLLLILEYVAGGDLAAWLANHRGESDLPAVLRFGLNLCDGMIHARAHGIVAHRDLKPQNCLVAADGTLKVTDFGLATVLRDAAEAPSDQDAPSGETAELTGAGRSVGTMTHRAPEQFRDAAAVDVRADVYAAGVMLYQMLAGALPFRVDPGQLARQAGLPPGPLGPVERQQLRALLDAEYARRHQEQPAPTLAVPAAPALAAIVQTCLAKDPADRFADFAALRGALGEVYEQLTNQPVPEPAQGAALGATDWTNKGTALSELGHFAEAVSCCRRALELDPRNARAWNTGGFALMRLGQLDDALACYARALASDPDLVEAVANRAIALSQQGQTAAALEAYQQAIRLRPGDPTLLINQAVFLAEIGRADQALAALDWAARRFPADPDVLVEHGCLLEQLGRAKEALVAFRRALGLNPHRARGWAGQGRALAAGGQWSEALPCFEQALALDDRDASTWAHRGMALDRLGQPTAALACYQRAVGLDPNDAAVWHLQAEAHRSLQQWAAALDCCDRGLALHDDFWPLWKTRGIVLAAQGRYAEALPCFERARQAGDQQSGAAVAQLRRRLGLA